MVVDAIRGEFSGLSSNQGGNNTASSFARAAKQLPRSEFVDSSQAVMHDEKVSSRTNFSASTPRRRGLADANADSWSFGFSTSLPSDLADQFRNLASGLQATPSGSNPLDFSPDQERFLNLLSQYRTRLRADQAAVDAVRSLLNEPGGRVVAELTDMQDASIIGSLTTPSNSLDINFAPVSNPSVQLIESHLQEFLDALRLNSPIFQNILNAATEGGTKQITIQFGPTIAGRAAEWNPDPTLRTITLNPSFFAGRDANGLTRGLVVFELSNAAHEAARQKIEASRLNGDYEFLSKIRKDKAGELYAEDIERLDFFGIQDQYQVFSEAINSGMPVDESADRYSNNQIFEIERAPRWIDFSEYINDQQITGHFYYYVEYYERNTPAVAPPTEPALDRGPAGADQPGPSIAPGPLAGEHGIEQPFGSGALGEDHEPLRLRGGASDEFPDDPLDAPVTGLGAGLGHNPADHGLEQPPGTRDPLLPPSGEGALNSQGGFEAQAASIGEALHSEVAQADNRGDGAGVAAAEQTAANSLAGKAVGVIEGAEKALGVVGTAVAVADVGHAIYEDIQAGDTGATHTKVRLAAWHGCEPTLFPAATAIPALKPKRPTTGVDLRLFGAFGRSARTSDRAGPARAGDHRVLRASRP